MAENASFAVKDKKFWILEQKLDEDPKVKKDDYKVNAWVFSDEVSAVRKMKELMKADKFDMNDSTALERLSNKYNLQEIEIARDKFNIKAVSMMKLVFIFAQEK